MPTLNLALATSISAIIRFYGQGNKIKEAMRKSNEVILSTMGCLASPDGIAPGDLGDVRTQGAARG